MLLAPPLIDDDLTREQFATLDPARVRELAAAASADLAQWAQRLALAAAAGDARGAARARHNLVGLAACFGAAPLASAAQGPLATPAQRAALIATATATAERIGRAMAQPDHPAHR